MSLLGLTIETTGQNITSNTSAAAVASNVASGRITSLLGTITDSNVTSHLMQPYDSYGGNISIGGSNNNTNSNKPEPLIFGFPKMDNFVDIFSICCSVAVIFGGLIPYIPQYLKIKRSASSDGFSTYVCLTLFIANILRIMFWFGHHFEPPLLIQSFVMIAGMLAMMELCVRVRNKRRAYSISAIGLGGANPRRRRSLIGKQEAMAANGNGGVGNILSSLRRWLYTADNDDELTPIFSSPPLPPQSALRIGRQNQHQHRQQQYTPHSLQLSGSSCSQLPLLLDSCSYHHRSQPDAVENGSVTAALLSPITATAATATTAETNGELQSDNISIDASVGRGDSSCSCLYGCSSESSPILNHTVGDGLASSTRDELSQQSLRAAPLPWQTQPALSSWSWSSLLHPFRTIKCLNSRDFWDWDEFFCYIQFLSLFTLIMSLLTYLLVDNYVYVETLGYVAVFSEAMLGVPQLIKNHTQKSTLGMSVEMVVMWLSGDLFKTLYFIIRKTPAQFYACGSIQVFVDILILYQVLHFRKPKVTYRKLPESG